MKKMFAELRAAQIQSWIDALAATKCYRIPLDQMREVLTQSQIEEMSRRQYELRRERSQLEKTYPDLTGDVAEYWRRAQKAFDLMSHAKSVSGKKDANKIGEEARELWENLHPSEQAMFYEPSDNDPNTGKAGIDNLEWPLPRLKNEAHDRADLFDVESYVQWEALTDALQSLQPPALPDDRPQKTSRLIRDLTLKNNG